MKLWVRHFLLESAKIFALLLGSFFVLYVLIDSSVHSDVLASAAPPKSELLRYYLLQFAKRAHILLPFALLVASIKVLSSLNLQGTLVTLRTAGLSAQRLLTPFLAAALLCAGVLWINFQWIYPRAGEQIASFEQRYFHGVTAGSHINAVRLKDGSHLLFQSYDPLHHSFFDAYWLKKPGVIFRIKELEAGPGIQSVGHYVDELRKGGQGFSVRESFVETELPGLRLDRQSLLDALTPPENLSITELTRRHPPLFHEKSDQQAAISTQLQVKLFLPLLCFLVVLGPAPFVFRFVRGLPLFFIYTFSIVLFLSLLTAIDAAAILGESRVASPAAVVALPFAALLAGAGTLYARLR